MLHSWKLKNKTMLHIRKRGLMGSNRKKTSWVWADLSPHFITSDSYYHANAHPHSSAPPGTGHEQRCLGLTEHLEHPLSLWLESSAERASWQFAPLNHPFHPNLRRTGGNRITHLMHRWHHLVLPPYKFTVYLNLQVWLFWYFAFGLINEQFLEKCWNTQLQSLWTGLISF